MLLKVHVTKNKNSLHGYKSFNTLREISVAVAPSNLHLLHLYIDFNHNSLVGVVLDVHSFLGVI
jgi:hypothetical protein